MSDYNNGYDEGYRAGMQKMREAGQRRIDELELAVRYADLAQQALDARKELEAKLAAKEKLMLVLAGDKIDLLSELAGVKGKLAKAVKALEYYGGWSDGSGGICGFDGGSLASITLAELKGQDDE